MRNGDCTRCLRGILRVAGAALIACSASGCILDFTGLTDGASPDAQDDAGSADAPEDSDPAGDVTAIDSGQDAVCSVLACGACQQPCPAERCPSIVLSSGAEFTDSPSGIAIDSDSLVWANQANGRIVRLSGDSPSPTVLAEGQSPTAIAAGSGFVAWAERDGVFACSTSDCNSTRRLLGNSMAPGSVAAVAVDGLTAWWTDRGTDASTGDGRVMRCNLESCTSPQLVADKQFRSHGLSLGAAGVFWTNQGDGFATGSVFRSSKSGGNPLEISQGVRLPTGIAADDTYAYWAQGGSSGAILRCPFLEGYCESPTDVAPAAGVLGHPADVVLGGARLYFSSTDDGAIRSCPVPSCGQSPPEVHVAGLTGLERIAVGSTCLFWTDGEDGGRVVKVAR